MSAATSFRRARVLGGQPGRPSVRVAAITVGPPRLGVSGERGRRPRTAVVSCSHDVSSASRSSANSASADSWSRITARWSASWRHHRQARIEAVGRVVAEVDRLVDRDRLEHRRARRRGGGGPVRRRARRSATHDAVRLGRRDRPPACTHGAASAPLTGDQRGPGGAVVAERGEQVGGRRAVRLRPGCWLGGRGRRRPGRARGSACGSANAGMVSPLEIERPRPGHPSVAQCRPAVSSTTAPVGVGHQEAVVVREPGCSWLQRPPWPWRSSSSTITLDGLVGRGRPLERQPQQVHAEQRRCRRRGSVVNTASLPMTTPCSLAPISAPHIHHGWDSRMAWVCATWGIEIHVQRTRRRVVVGRRRTSGAPGPRWRRGRCSWRTAPRRRSARRACRTPGERTYVHPAAGRRTTHRR